MPVVVPAGIVPGPDAHWTKLMRVLVCDDDPAARFVAKRWLTSALGCTVADCEDGVQALELLSQQPFDLALVDLDLPRLSGIEVVEAIRANELTRDLPIVILSQERREEVVRTLLTLGVSAYLLKPLRERTVLGRIGPILASRRSTRSISARTLSDVRLSTDAPALLVDGDQNFRHAFASVAGQFGPVMVAESGADALALFRRSPVNLLFVGTGLGIMGAATLIRKIRDIESSPTRIIGLGVAPEAAADYDGVMPRAFVLDAIEAGLQPYVKVPGPLSALEDLAPKFADCLTSAVTQVFGMMGGLEAAAAGEGGAEPGEAVVSAVTVGINGSFDLDLELVLPRSIAEEVSVRLLGCEKSDLDADGLLATAQELGNMVSGRLDAWLKGRNLASHCSLPATRVAAADGEPIGAGEGFSHRFTLDGLSGRVVLRARVRQAAVAA
ncbi:MAG: response regulator [Candidatus Binatia bacterium]